jgi:hypothetical protein
MPRPLIRPAVEHDLVAVRACLVETWHDTYDALYGVDEVRRTTESWHAVPVLHSQLADPTNTCLVAELGGSSWVRRCCKLSPSILQSFIGST